MLEEVLLVLGICEVEGGLMLDGDELLGQGPRQW